MFDPWQKECGVVRLRGRRRDPVPVATPERRNTARGVQVIFGCGCRADGSSWSGQGLAILVCAEHKTSGVPAW